MEQLVVSLPGFFSSHHFRLGFFRRLTVVDFFSMLVSYSPVYLPLSSFLANQHFPNVHAITDLNLLTYPNQPIPSIIANFFRKQIIDFKETNKRF